MTGSSVSAVTAYSAHREWASRPPDERYPSVHALFQSARARRQRIEERTIDTGEFTTEAVDGDLALSETSGRIAALTHWSFGQLATIASAPPNYLRTLPATIASSAINFGLQRVERERHQLFVEDTAPWTVHAITSPRYARVHHDELASRVLDLMALHPAWHLPLGYKDGEYGAERVPSTLGTPRTINGTLQSRTSCVSVASSQTAKDGTLRRNIRITRCLVQPCCDQDFKR